MKMKGNSILLILTCVFGFYNPLSAQEFIQVIDRTTLQPIENVCISSKDLKRNSLTNKNGEVSVSDFKKNDTLIFRHPSYKIVQAALNDIASVDYLVRMRESSILFEEIVISANKWKQFKREVPNKIATIKAKDISFENPQTSADLISSSGQVFVQKSQLGGGSPMIRGFATNSVLLVIDGVRMNNAIYRSGNIQNVISLDAHIIENTEVIFGPGSVIYGSDALGGVMNFQSKDPKLSTSSKENLLEANALTRYSTANNENTAHVDFNFGTKKFASLTSVTFSSYEDLRTGSNRSDDYPEWGKRTEYQDFINGVDTMIKNKDENLQVRSGYNQINLTQKLLYQANKYTTFKYAFHYSTTSDLPRYDRLIQKNDDGRLKYAEWYYGPQEWMMNAFYVNLSKKTKIYDEVKAIFAYQDYMESRHDRKFGKSDLRSRTEELDIFTLNVDFDKKLGEKSNLYYGLEGVYNLVASTAFKKDIFTAEVTPTSTRYPDGGSTYATYSTYANFKTNLNKHFTFIAGVRYSYISIHADFDDKSFFNFPYDAIDLNPNAVNGGIGMVYRPSESWQLNYNLSSGFRAPNIDDIAKVFDSEPGTVIVPNDKLKPEYAYNADFSVIKNFTNLVKVELNLFYTSLTDAMVRRDFTFNGKDSIMYDGELSKVEAVVNSGEAFVTGGSFIITADITEQLSIRSAITYTQGGDLSEDIPLRHIPPLFGITRLSYKTNKFRIDFYANYNARKDFEDMSPSEQDKAHMYAPDGSSPAWMTLNLKGSYQLNRQVQFNFGVENIADVHYRPYSSGISAPGRNFIFALRASI